MWATWISGVGWYSSVKGDPCNLFHKHVFPVLRSPLIITFTMTRKGKLTNCITNVSCVLQSFHKGTNNHGPTTLNNLPLTIIFYSCLLKFLLHLPVHWLYVFHPRLLWSEFSPLHITHFCECSAAMRRPGGWRVCGSMYGVTTNQQLVQVTFFMFSFWLTIYNIYRD